MIRFGPAGWDYPDWRGAVYPRKPPRGFDPLAYLAGFFDAVEVNSTFYRPQRAEVARSWCSRTQGNPRFKFTAKLWQRFTHDRGAYGAGEVKSAREALDALASEGRLGAVLLQFPWSFRRDEPALEWLRDLFGAFRGLPLVLEVRHASWNVPDTYRELMDRGVGFVNLDQPLFQHSIAPGAVATSPVGYVRVHGRNYKDWFRQGAGRDARYDYLYTAAELRPWAERTRTLADTPRVEDVYVVTNNHFQGKAVANAAMLASMVSGEEVAVPPEVLARYPDVLAGHARADARSPEAQQRLL